MGTRCEAKTRFPFRKAQKERDLFFDSGVWYSCCVERAKNAHLAELRYKSKTGHIRKTFYAESERTLLLNNSDFPRSLATERNSTKTKYSYLYSSPASKSPEEAR